MVCTSPLILLAYSRYHVATRITLTDETGDNRQAYPARLSTNTSMRTSLGLDLGVFQRPGTRFGLFRPAAWALDRPNHSYIHLDAPT